MNLGRPSLIPHISKRVLTEAGIDAERKAKSDRELAAASYSHSMGRVSEADVRNILSSAKDIATRIHGRWLDAVIKRSDKEYNPDDRIDVTGSAVPVDNADQIAGSDSYETILYKIVRTNLNDAIDYGNWAKIDPSVELVTADEFAELYSYDWSVFSIEADNKNSRIVTDEDSLNNSVKSEKLDKVLEYYTKHSSELYDKFNSMLHADFPKASNPRPQFIINDKNHTVTLAGTQLWNARVGEIHSVTVITDSVGADCHSFIINSMLDDVVTKLSSMEIMRNTTQESKRHLGGMILRYGVNKITGKIIPKWENTRVETKTQRFFKDGFASVIQGPAYITYKPGTNVIQCPEKLYALFISSILETVRNNYVEDNAPEPDADIDSVKSKYFSDCARVKVDGMPMYEMPAGRLLPVINAGIGTVFSTIMTEGGTNSTIDGNADHGDGTDDGGAHNARESEINDGMQRWQDDMSNDGMGTADDARFGEARTSLSTKNSIAALNRIIGIPGVVKSTTEVKRMDTNDLSEYIITLFNALASVFGFAVKVDDSPRHKIVTIMRGGEPVTIDKMKTIISEVAEDEPSISKYMKTSITPITAMMEFMCAVPDVVPRVSNAATAADALQVDDGAADEQSTGTPPVPREAMEPVINMMNLVFSYARNGGNDSMGTLVTSHVMKLAMPAVNGMSAGELWETIESILELADEPSTMSTLGEYVSNTRITNPIQYKNGLLGTLKKTTDRQSLIDDWSRVLYSGNADVAPLVNSDIYNKCMPEATVPEIAAAYYGNDIDAVIDSFDGDARKYIDAYYNPDIKEGGIALCARNLYNSDMDRVFRLDWLEQYQQWKDEQHPNG